MEFFLDIAWLQLATTGVVFCLLRPSDQRTNATGFISLCCVLILLFPVISVADDLAVQQFAAEDASANLKKLYSNANVNAGTTTDLPAVLPLIQCQTSCWQVLFLATIAELQLRFSADTFRAPSPPTSIPPLPAAVMSLCF